jgi:GNAT superfamily N-acetyltransferase
MTPVGGGPAVVQAGEADADALSDLIAESFFDLAPSQWLIPDPAARRRVFPGYFLIYVEHALAGGLVHTTADRTAAALWLPAGALPPDGYRERLAAVTGPAASRFLAFDEALGSHHPAGIPHQHLAILAVRPDRQGRGAGTALMRAHHAALDHVRTPAYLEASSPRSRDLYLRHGYAPLQGAPYRVPGGGPLMWPMWREPRPTAGPKCQRAGA